MAKGSRSRLIQDNDGKKVYGNRITPSRAQEHFSNRSVAHPKIAEMIRNREMSEEERATRNVVKPLQQTLHVIPKDAFLPMDEESNEMVKVDFSPYNFELRHLRGIEQLPFNRILFLDLSSNKLKSLKLGRSFRKVQIIRAQSNLVSTVNVRCHSLRILDLRNNKLEQIPSLVEMPKLERLNLAKNNMSGSFYSLRKVPKLWSLDLSNNRFEFQRSEFLDSVAFLGKLTALTTITLQDNPFERTVADYADIVVDTCTRLQELDNQPVDMPRIKRAMQRLGIKQTETALHPPTGDITKLDLSRADAAKVSSAMDELLNDLATARSQISERTPKKPKASMFDKLTGGDKPRADIITAAFLGHDHRVRELCELGENVNVKDDQGRTAMMWACIQGNVACVTELVVCGNADVNLKDGTKKTALMWAASRGYPGCIQALLRQNASLDLQDKRGRTALMHATTTAVTTASLERAVECIQIMLEAQADTSLVTKKGRTAIDLADHPAVRAALGAAAKGPMIKDKVVTAEDLSSRRGYLTAEPSSNDRDNFTQFLSDLAGDRTDDRMKQELVMRMLPGKLKFTSVQAMMVLSQFQDPEARVAVADSMRPCLTDPHHFEELTGDVVAIPANDPEADTGSQLEAKRRKAQRRARRKQAEEEAASGLLDNPGPSSASPPSPSFSSSSRQQSVRGGGRNRTPQHGSGGSSKRSGSSDSRRSASSQKSSKSARSTKEHRERKERRERKEQREGGDSAADGSSTRRSKRADDGDGSSTYRSSSGKDKPRRSLSKDSRRSTGSSSSQSSRKRKGNKEPSRQRSRVGADPRGGDVSERSILADIAESQL